MIHQLLFGGSGFDAKTTGGQFIYIPNPNGVQGPQTTLSYSANVMTTWFNNGSFFAYLVPQSKSGTLTVFFDFTVPVDYKLYLACYMGRFMNKNNSYVHLNGSLLLNGWGNSSNNLFVATSGTTIGSMDFSGSVSGSGYNDGRVVSVENFVLVPNSATVNSSWDGDAIISNIPGSIAAGP